MVAVDEDGGSGREVDLQGQNVLTPLPAEPKGVVIGVDAEVTVERPVRVPQPDEVDDAPDDRPIERGLDLVAV